MERRRPGPYTSFERLPKRGDDHDSEKGSGQENHSG